MLAQSAYGKSGVRLVQVARRGDRHDLRDLTVAIQFEGRLRRVVHRRRQQRGAADRHDEEYRLRARRARAAAGARAVRPHARRGTSSSATRACVRVRDRPDRAPLEPAPRRRARARPRVRARRARVADGERPGATAAARIVGAGIVGSADPEVRAFGVRRLPSRRIHDAARDARPAACDVADRDLALSRSGHRLRVRRGTPCGACCSRCSPSTTASQCSTRFTRWAQAVLDSIRRRHRHPPRDAQQASPAGRPLALGLENRNEIFVPTDEPYGLIEATLVR